ncbi:hypothetical protein V1498_08885 [Peribacillus sp. SCS-26]|uniref:hypothetical protein n=1 Tax=Paraperibacillus marinus TaxID=3115295 RepID=UPI0039065363
MIKDEIAILTAAALFITIILSILLLYLVIRKTRENWMRRKVDKYKEELNPAVLDVLLTGQNLEGIKTDSNIEKRALEESLSSYASVLEGSGVKENITSIAEFHLSRDYSRKLKSMHWSRRMNSLYHIDLFRLKALEEDVLFLLKKKISSDAEKNYSLRILASFGHEEAAARLMEAGRTLPQFEYRNILSRLPVFLFERLMDSFEKCPQPLQNALLDSIGMQKKLDYTGFLEQAIDIHSGETRIRAFKALVNIGYVSDVTHYLPYAASSEWQERMLAARLFGVVRDGSLLSVLSGLLRDSSWWVRFQAGGAIKQYPQGDDLLLSIYQNDSDPFARDMAWEWMNKGAVH